MFVRQYTGACAFYAVHLLCGQSVLTDDFRTLIIPEKALVLSSVSNARTSVDCGRLHYEYACFPYICIRSVYIRLLCICTEDFYIFKENYACPEKTALNGQIRRFFRVLCTYTKFHGLFCAVSTHNILCPRTSAVPYPVLNSRSDCPGIFAPL